MNDVRPTAGLADYTSSDDNQQKDKEEEKTTANKSTKTSKVRCFSQSMTQPWRQQSQNSFQAEDQDTEIDASDQAQLRELQETKHRSEI